MYLILLDLLFSKDTLLTAIRLRGQVVVDGFVLGIGDEQICAHFKARLFDVLINYVLGFLKQIGEFNQDLNTLILQFLQPSLLL